MLGLRRNTVKIESYTKAWESEFEKSKKEIKNLLKNKEVATEHIGSTSIKNIVSKPIIDIGIGTNSKKEITEIVEI